MKAVYTVQGQISGLTKNGTVFYLTAPSNKVVELLNVSLTNESNATNFQMQAILARITTLGSPSGFTAVTPNPQEVGDQAAGTTASVGTNTSGEPTTYGASMLQEGVPSLVGLRWEPNSPDERIYIPPGGIVGFKVGNLPAGGINLDIKVVFKEIG